MDMIGTISEWNAEKGYGFITLSGQSKRIFFQLSDVSNREHLPKVDEYVRFELTKDVYGTVRATHVQRPATFNFSVALAVWFTTVLCSSVYLFDYSVIACVFYFLVSSITYAVYAFDKSAEQAGSWRVPTFTLYLLALIGGWPGALLAQSFLYHRYHDDTFKLIFWLMTIINFSTYCWTLTEQGHEQMYLLLGELLALTA